MTVKTPVAIPFSQTAVPGRAVRYGDCFWQIILADGRTMALMADRIEITPIGALIAWQESRLADNDQGDGLPRGRIPLNHPFSLLALAPGHWLSFYAASMIDGSAVCADWIEDPGSTSPKK